MIYTSYYAVMNKIPENIVPVSIAGKAPDFYHGIEYKVLAPRWDFFKKYKKDGDWKYYTDCYFKQVLNNLSINKVLCDLFEKANSYEICLLCYEKPKDKCHRHLVAEWLNFHHVPCSELEFEENPK